MPNSLIQLLNWATNDKAFNAGDNTPETQRDGLRKCQEQIEYIVAGSSSVENFTFTISFRMILAIL
jgi:hypothetical protein